MADHPVEDHLLKRGQTAEQGAGKIVHIAESYLPEFRKSAIVAQSSEHTDVRHPYFLRVSVKDHAVRKQRMPVANRVPEIPRRLNDNALRISRSDT